MRWIVVFVMAFIFLLAFPSIYEYEIPNDNGHLTGKNLRGSYERVHPTTDLVYLGAFRVPGYATNNTTFSYAGRGMCFYPYGNPNNGSDEHPGSLFVVGRDPNRDIYRVAEISIPKPVISDRLEDLPEARYIQEFSDITGGMQQGGLTQGKQVMDVQFMAANETGDHNDYLYWPLYRYYLPQYDMLVFGRSMGTNLSTAGEHMEGLWRIDNASASSVQKYMFPIPDEFAGEYLNGSKLAVGRYRMVNGGSWGPALFATAPWKYENSTGVIPNGTVINGTTLIFYPGYDAPYHTNYSRMLRNYSHGDIWNDGVWITIGNKSAVVIGGKKEMRLAQEGNGTEYYGLPGPYASRWGGTAKGYHGEPNYESLLFYDPNDIIRAIRGEIEPYQVQPYAFYQFEEHIFRISGNDGLGGMAYDAVHHYLYVMELGVGKPGSQFDRSPVVHVFRIVDAGRPLDRTPPTAPDNLRVTGMSNTSITISWDPSTDDMGSVMYVVYRLNSTPNQDASWLWDINWSNSEMTDPICNATVPVPIGFTTTNEFTDDMAYAFSPPHRYLVRAFDSVMNPSDFSEVLEIGDSPIPEFFAPTPENGAHIDRDYFYVNVTVFDVNGDYSNLSLELYNSSGLLKRIQTDNSTIFYNFSSLAPDEYEVIVVAHDSAGNVGISRITVFVKTDVPEIESAWVLLLALLFSAMAVRRRGDG